MSVQDVVKRENVSSFASVNISYVWNVLVNTLFVQYAPINTSGEKLL
jgi:hypothetical protein